jgi:hypothetical protein
MLQEIIDYNFLLFDNDFWVGRQIRHDIENGMLSLSQGGALG